MASFILAGVMSDIELAKAEAVANHLQLNLPSYKASVQLVAEEEWTDYLATQMRTYGWRACDPEKAAVAKPAQHCGGGGGGDGGGLGPRADQARFKRRVLAPEGRVGGKAVHDERTWCKSCVWRETGELIGDAQTFIDLMAHTYNQHVDLPDELLRQIAQENLALGLRRQEKERARRLALEEERRAAEARERAARDAEATRSARRRRSSARAPKSAAPATAAAAEGGMPASASAASKQTQIRLQTTGKTIDEERDGAK